MTCESFSIINSLGVFDVTSWMGWYEYIVENEESFGVDDSHEALWRMDIFKTCRKGDIRVRARKPKKYERKDERSV